MNVSEEASKVCLALMCGLLDIPVYNNLVESLHVMFTTYLAGPRPSFPP